MSLKKLESNEYQELLTAVLGDGQTFWFDDICGEVYIVVGDNESGEDMYDIHIDTFAFKCKKYWARRGYEISSFSGVKGFALIQARLDTNNKQIQLDKMADTEQEAIIMLLKLALDKLGV